MDGISIAQKVLAYLVSEGIELSDDLGEAEMLLREQVLKIGAAALEHHLSEWKLGYEGSSRACARGGRQRRPFEPASQGMPPRPR